MKDLRRRIMDIGSRCYKDNETWVGRLETYRCESPEEAHEVLDKAIERIQREAQMETRREAARLIEELLHQVERTTFSRGIRLQAREWLDDFYLWESQVDQ